MDNFDIIKYLAKNPLLQEDAEQEAFEKDEQYAFDLIGKLTSKIKSKEDIKKVINALHKGLFVNKNVDSLFDSSPGKDIANIFVDALEDIVPDSVINRIKNDYKDVIQSIKDNDWEYFVGSEDEDDYDEDDYEVDYKAMSDRELGKGSYSEEAALETIDRFLKNPKLYIHLNLNHSHLKYLPDYLKVVERGMQMNGSHIVRIPDNFTVEGSLEARGCLNLVEIGKNLKVRDWLDLSNCKNLKSLPSGVEVGGNLYIGGTGIKELPADIKVGGEVRDFMGA